MAEERARRMSRVSAIYSVLSDARKRDSIAPVPGKSPPVVAKPKPKPTAATVTGNLIIGEQRTRRRSPPAVDRISVRSADCVLLLQSNSARRRRHSLVDSSVKPQKVLSVFCSSSFI